MIPVVTASNNKRKRDRGMVITFVILSMIVVTGVFYSGGVLPQVAKMPFLTDREGILLEENDSENGQPNLQINTLPFITTTLTPTGLPPTASPIPSEQPCSDRVAVDLVLDTSGSMSFGGGEKMANLKSGVLAFMNLQQDDNIIGAQRFASNVSDVFPIDRYSVNRSIIPNAINGLSPAGGTDMTGGLTLARQRINEAQARFPGYSWTIIFFSDGEPSAGTTNPIFMANAIKQSGIRIITVGLEMNARGRENMLAMASSPNDYYDAINASQLQQIYESLVTEVCQ